MKTIEIIVTGEGKSYVQTKGFNGASCREASRFIEQALGSRAGEQVTPEFYQSVTPRQNQQQRS